MHHSRRIFKVWFVCGWFENVGFCPFDVAGPAGSFFGGGYGVPLGFAGAAISYDAVRFGWRMCGGGGGGAYLRETTSQPWTEACLQILDPVIGGIRLAS